MKGADLTGEGPIGHNLGKYEKWFREYTREFLVGSEFDMANVQLKIDHTIRVLEFARQIAGCPGPRWMANGGGSWLRYFMMWEDFRNMLDTAPSTTRCRSTTRIREC